MNTQNLNQMENQEEKGELISKKEAIEFTGLSRATLDRARVSGRLTAYKKNDNWKVYFYKSDLEEFMNEVKPA